MSMFNLKQHNVDNILGKENSLIVGNGLQNPEFQNTVFITSITIVLSDTRPPNAECLKQHYQSRISHLSAVDNLE